MKLKYLKFISIAAQDLCSCSIPVDYFCAGISILFPWDALSRAHVWVAWRLINLLISGDNSIS